MKKVDDMLQKKAMFATQVQPVIALHRLECQAPEFNDNQPKESTSQNYLTPSTEDNNLLKELEFLRKENLFLRDECAKKDKHLEEVIGKLDEVISRLEAVTMKVNAGKVINFFFSYFPQFFH